MGRKQRLKAARLLGIPNVLDRLIQQATCQILTPIFDPTFSESSFGFRPVRSAHGAAKQVQKIIRQGYAHCVDVDLSKFFDRVQHDVLMSRVSRKVHDQRLLGLVGRYLRAGVMVEGVLQPTEEGSPQGGPLSPLLSNILLDDLDKELERRGLRFVHYPRTKVRNLVRLGVNLDMAIKHATSRKTYWRMSRTPAMRYAMPNKWLAQQGLLSLKQLWSELAPLRGIA